MASEIEASAAAADAARTHAAGTLAALGNKLDTGRMIDEATQKAKAAGQQLISRAGDTARAHPVAIGAAVAAVGLALFARHRIGNATLDLDHDLEGWTEYEEPMGEVAPRLYADEYVDEDDAPAAQPLIGEAAEAVAANPLLSILAGLAAGAVLGLLLPAAPGEKKALAGIGNRLLGRD